MHSSRKDQQPDCCSSCLCCCCHAAGCWVLSRGTSAMLSLAFALTTPAMVTILTVCSGTHSSRCAD
jgi:hypothetical protein